MKNGIQKLFLASESNDPTIMEEATTFLENDFLHYKLDSSNYAACNGILVGPVVLNIIIKLVSSTHQTGICLVFH